VSPGFEQIFSEMVIDALERHKNLWDLCQFHTLPMGSPVGIRLAEYGADKRWTCCEYRSRCSAIALPENWERYTEKLSSEDRKNLARYSERLKKRYSTRIYRCSDEQQLPACLDALFRLHQGRWLTAGDPGSFASADRREFYQLLSRCLLNRRWLELWVLELNGEIAAVQFAFRYRDTVFQLQEGYDHTRPSDRAGYVLRGAVLKHLISEGVRNYDFLGGEDAYKARWAAEPGSYRSICLARPFTYAAFLLQTADTAAKSKEWLRSRLPNPAWSFLHQLNMSIRRKPDAKLNSAAQAG
jgi:CelD/BcsL family acetyltransferase involved in cellulose biosynthesis